LGRSRSRLDVRIPLIVGLFFFLILVFQFVPITSFGFDSTALASFITILPGLSFVVVGLLLLVKVKGLFSIASFGVLGFGFAVLMGETYSIGLITVQMLSGLTIAELELWCVIISVLSGGIVTAVTSRR
jgi:hypothetical protein